MTLSDIINIIGLFFDIIGALLMYFNSQSVSFQTYIYSRQELIELDKKAKLKNKRIKFGAILLFIGFLIQIIATFFS